MIICKSQFKNYFDTMNLFLKAEEERQSGIVMVEWLPSYSTVLWDPGSKNHSEVYHKYFGSVGKHARAKQRRIAG